MPRMEAEIWDALRTLNRKLDKIINMLQGVEDMAVSLDALTSEVGRQTTVDASANTLLAGLSAQIADLIAKSGDTVDPTALQALVDNIKANNDGLVNAVSANTPAAT